MSPREIPAAVWLVFLLIAIPILSIMNGIALRSGKTRSGRAARVQSLPRLLLYQTVVLNQAPLLVVTLLLDWIDHGAVLRQALAFPPHGWLWVLGCIAAQEVIAISTMVVRRVRRLPLDRGVLRLLPRSGAERLGFAGVALSAGVSEEILYRGFALGHLLAWGVPVVVAVALATLAFGLAHGYKSLAGMLRSGLSGLVVTIPVLVTGTLLPSIVAHVLIDVISGNITLPLARRLGVEIPEPVGAGAPVAVAPDTAPAAAGSVAVAPSLDES